MKRATLMILPLLCATPAIAQSPVAQVPPELGDRAMADKLARSMQAMSKAFLDLPVGEVQAAIDGREPTAAEKKLTVRDVGRRDNRNFDRDFQQRIANARPVIENSMKALSAALPALLQGVEQMQQSLDRATANLPSPAYPKR